MAVANGPRLTIIVPVYNSAGFLTRCLNSILAQTHRDFELLLIDDGSTDASGTICDEYARRDPRVKVVRKTNGGESDARNTGMDRATGEYVGWVDADDVAEPRMFETLVDAMDRASADLAICGFTRVDFDGVPQEETRVADRPTTEEIATDDGEICALPFRAKIGGYFWNKLFKRSLLVERCDVSLAMCPDLDFLVRYLSRVERAIIIPEQLYRYRESHYWADVRRFPKRVSMLDALEKVDRFYAERVPESLTRFRRHAFGLALEMRDWAWTTRSRGDDPILKRLDSYVRRMLFLLLASRDVPIRKKWDYLRAYLLPKRRAPSSRS